MPMHGVISTYDRTRCCGYIREAATDTRYFFSSLSVTHRNAPIAAGARVAFDALPFPPAHQQQQQQQPRREKDVAVRVRILPPARDDRRYRATVKFFKEAKGYGFAACADARPPVDAYLNSRNLREAGLPSVAPGAVLDVKLKFYSDGRKPRAYDVRVVSTGPPPGPHRAPQPPRPPHSPHRAPHVGGPSPFSHHQQHQQRSSHLTEINQNLKSRRPEPPAPSSSVSSQMPSSQPAAKNKSNAIPSKEHIVPTKEDTASTKATSTKERKVSTKERAVSTKTASTTQPAAASTEIERELARKRSLLTKVDVAKLPDGGRRLRAQIAELETRQRDSQLEQSVGRLRLDGKAPGIGRWSTAQLAELETRRRDAQLSQSLGRLRLDGNAPAIGLWSTAESRKDKAPMSAKEKIQREFEASLVDLVNRHDGNRSNRGTARGRPSGGAGQASQVTSEAIEKLHVSLESCPEPTAQLPDPDGLLVTLMTHQQQALAWLAWREQQEVSGGILADDMGLGKTLTMIALVLHQEEKEQVEREGKEERDSMKKLDKKTRNAENFVETHSTLIVSPASLIYHWKNEIRNRCEKGLLSIHLYHGPKREKVAEKLAEFDIVITTYDLVRRSLPKNEASDKKTEGSSKAKADSSNKTEGGENALFEIGWRRVVLDEAHQIKNSKSKTSLAACQLHARSRWALSGTPIQNDESDLFAMVKFLHCRPFDDDKTWKSEVANGSERGRERLKTLVSSLVLRRTKAQRGVDGRPLVALPERTFKTHTIKLGRAEREVYDKLESESRNAYRNYATNRDDRKQGGGDKTKRNNAEPGAEKKVTATSLLVQLLRLRQCCCHLSLLDGKVDASLLENDKQDFAVEDLFQSLSLAACSSPQSAKYSGTGNSCYFKPESASSKSKIVIDTLRANKVDRPDDKAVVVSQWTSFLSVIEHQLDAASISFATIDGSVSAMKRMELVDEFNRNPFTPRVMLVSLQAGGVGLNLIGANHIFLLDMHWNPALEQQACDRIYRVGQKKNVFVHKFITEKTVEEQIVQLQERKRSLADHVMEGANADNKIKLTLADMKMLFGC